MVKKITANNRTIGSLKKVGGRFEFTKRVNPNKHLMRVFNAYGIQEIAFNKYFKGKEGLIIIKETKSPERTLEATIEEWEQGGFVGDFGAGEQRFLKIEKMKIKTNNQKQLV